MPQPLFLQILSSFKFTIFFTGAAVFLLPSPLLGAAGGFNNFP
jgi:hypothetical protein